MLCATLYRLLRTAMTICGIIILSGVIYYGVGWTKTLFGQAASWINKANAQEKNTLARPMPFERLAILAPAHSQPMAGSAGPRHLAGVPSLSYQPDLEATRRTVKARTMSPTPCSAPWRSPSRPRGRRWCHLRGR